MSAMLDAYLVPLEDLNRSSRKGSTWKYHLEQETLSLRVQF